LSPSEEEVYPLLLAGLSNREIAAALGIELPAANARVNRVCQVYGVTTVRRLLARRIAELEAARGETPRA
jgi:DNA-binding CsgD family transcriptional regulator